MTYRPLRGPRRSELSRSWLIKHYATEIDVISIKRKDNSVTITIAYRYATLYKGVPRPFKALGPVKLPAVQQGRRSSDFTISRKSLLTYGSRLNCCKTCGEILPAMRKNMKKIICWMMQGAIGARLPLIAKILTGTEFLSKNMVAIPVFCIPSVYYPIYGIGMTLH